MDALLTAQLATNLRAKHYYAVFLARMRRPQPITRKTIFSETALISLHSNFNDLDNSTEQMK
jgi:hypothetical protein